ncbi:hypothetical protein SERLADRAFT_479723 [Serpula lacrymans var. lacrymans S7.9]|uniref:Uncharacterized protein n=1 Tax=Serpula lacrymans var. lacrymans (strain S7.9) TaxID=578457 RepID=F8PCB3_SERL9|nr:uncharacterized protein SERLADRAFT_479723 [Serpula lacrymans var. lacrymans S7.9]EGO19313.1 hypothetical protein SERLADRAFT_479723 [Serpula lacrymans var. lacrymans S7.9]
MGFPSDDLSQVKAQSSECHAGKENMSLKMEESRNSRRRTYHKKLSSTIRRYGHLGNNTVGRSCCTAVDSGSDSGSAGPGYLRNGGIYCGSSNLSVVILPKRKERKSGKKGSFVANKCQ